MKPLTRFGVEPDTRRRRQTARPHRRWAAVLTAFALATPLGILGAAGATAAPEEVPPILAAPSMPSEIPSEKPRTVITQDGEIDDIDSLVRFFYYANEVQLEGLIYSSSMFHWRGEDPDAPPDVDGVGQCGGGFTGWQSCVEPWRWTGTDWLYEFIDLYGEIHPNLVQHDPDFPSAEDVLAVTKIGNVDYPGAMSKDTEGSEFLEELILDDGAPIHVQTWGGLNTLARALKAIEDDYSDSPHWPALQERVADKIVIYNILNQDNTLADYIRPNWPDLKIIDNQSQFWSFAYQWARRVPQPYQYALKADFMVENFLTGHGGLLSRYHTWGDGQAIEGEHLNEDRWSPDRSENPQAQFPTSGRDIYDFISEGDSPAFFYLLDFNGLRQSEDATWGGWGGRFAEVDYGWLDTSDFNPYTGQMDRSYPQTRWVEEIQNDWAARADWGVTDYEGANHVPEASVAEGLDLTVYPGREVTLTGSATDPDGDDVTLSWWQYEEAGTYHGAVDLSDDGEGTLTVSVPQDVEPGQTIHLILDAQDDGEHTLVHHQRVVLTIGHSAGEDGIPIVADIPELGGPEGALTLSVANYGDGVVLTGPTNVGDRLRFDGTLPQVTVTDTRNATQAGDSGWTVSGRATDFTSGTAELDAAHLGWTPWADSLRDGVILGGTVNGILRGGPGLAAAATLATAPNEARLGIAAVRADLLLEAPVDTPEGTYESRLKVSLFPVD